MLRIITLNLNGIRSATRRGFFPWMRRQRADIVCVQELKAQAADMTRQMLVPARYRGYFHYAQKKGYSGAGVYALQQPERVVEGIGVKAVDEEGRYVECEFGKLSVISVYLPSGSSGAHRQQAKFAFMAHFLPHLKALRREGQEIVLCGDWNIAHREIDLRNWRANRKNSGFLPEEHAWLTRVFEELGWVDVYRRLHPAATDAAYTWWSNRGQAYAKNVGWRLDYQIATPGIAATAQRAAIYKSKRFSDHAPLTIDYDWPRAAARQNA